MQKELFANGKLIDVVCLGEGDGVWCVAQSHLPANPTILSFGVGRDISWDVAMIKGYGAKIHAFDPTPISLEWIRAQSLPQNFIFHAVGLSNLDGMVEFALPTSHGISYVANYNGPNKASARCEVKQFDTLIRELGISRIDVLKLDIEGSEFDVLDDILNSPVTITQLLIEFHGRFYGETGEKRTRSCIEKIIASGYKLFYASSRGLEYCFLKAADRVSYLSNRHEHR